jgi:hypothetical protein
MQRVAQLVINVGKVEEKAAFNEGQAKQVEARVDMKIVLRNVTYDGVYKRIGDFPTQISN